ncbi:hypothetical protein DH2020_031665 [Rehmannia glutinosa]|uniref:3-deoxy-manno-octulosonate cytidylyltransferase n=1 Tax=Rehmannia glutinosa TaxID=99300 RepID=A0ABR0VKA9_REHGL
MPICSPSSSSSSSSSSSTKSWIIHGLAVGAAAAVALGTHAYLYYRRSGKFRSRVIGIIPARFASSRFQGKPLVHILGKPMIQRCNEALQKLGEQYDVVVNIQGDEPLIEPEIIDGIVRALQAAPDAVFSTAVTSLKPEDAFDPNRVKCVSFDSKFLKIYPELPPTPLQLEEDLEQLKVLENGYKMKVPTRISAHVIKVDHEAHGVDVPEDVDKIEHYMRERNLQ